MTQASFPWTTDGTGDGAASGFTANQWHKFWRSLVAPQLANKGVSWGYLNGLAVSNPAGSTIRVATGSALVHGTFYENDAQQDFTPGDGTYPALPTNNQIHRVVLRKSWAAQTVRLAFISGTDAGSPSTPALTQTDLTTWEIPLYQFQISSAGAVSATADQREYLDSRTRRFLVPCVGANNITAGTAIDRTDERGYLSSNTQRCDFYGNFFVPVDYIASMTIKAIVSNDSAAGNIYVTNQIYYGALTEVYSQHSNTTGPTAVATTNGLQGIQQVALTSIAAGDYVSPTLVRNATDVLDTMADFCRVIGWLVEYTAAK
jgi:hypothetical protein